MKTILTGASGFLGEHIYHELLKISEVITISRVNANVNVDLVKEIPHVPSADLVIHCAGKAHFIPKSTAEKQLFFDVNVTGTSNFLKGLERALYLPKSFVFISTVAVYGRNSGILINEKGLLNAEDPYGQSKIQAEQLVRDWCGKNGVICGILRLPLLVGESPPGNLGIMIKGIEKGYYFNIAGGKARKSMVLASDVAKIIPAVAKMGGIYNLTDTYHPSFAELSYLIGLQLNKRNIKNIPMWLANIFAQIGNLLGDNAPINTKKLMKITSDLTFDDSKAKNLLNWRPESVLNGFRI